MLQQLIQSWAAKVSTEPREISSSRGSVLTLSAQNCINCCNTYWSLWQTIKIIIFQIDINLCPNYIYDLFLFFCGPWIHIELQNTGTSVFVSEFSHFCHLIATFQKKSFNPDFFMYSQNSMISFDYSSYVAKNFSNFVSFPWKLHNQYCHNSHWTS